MKERLVNLVYAIFAKLMRLRNRNKLKIFVYTDSRGCNVISKLGKTPIGSYVDFLVKTYNTEYFICPEKFTTIQDFIEKIGSTAGKYDLVILHCGVVDFSPRPVSNISMVIESKQKVKYIKALVNDNEAHHKSVLGPKYYDEDVQTLYSKDYLNKHILPRLYSMPNLLWIDSNRFIKGWDGNYPKGRPQCIQESVFEYEKLLEKGIKHKISLKNWTDDDIKKYTIDNIHFTPLGFQNLCTLLKYYIDGIESERIKEYS